MIDLYNYSSVITDISLTIHRLKAQQFVVTISADPVIMHAFCSRIRPQQELTMPVFNVS